MIELQTTDFINLELDYTTLDFSMRKYQDEGNVIYIGQGSQVIQIAEKDIGKFIEYINKVRHLEYTGTSMGFLK